MTGRPDTTRRSELRSFRRPLALGLLASVAVHAAAFAVARRAALRPPATLSTAEASREPPDATVRSPDALRAVRVAETREIEIPPPPEDVSAEPAEVREPGEAAGAALAASGLEARGFRRPSHGTGGSARGAPVSPPVPRSVLPEWDPPDEVRGLTVRVRVRVDSAGRPVGPVELRPETPSESFDVRLVKKVLEMRFSPARTADGRPVQGWAELTFSF